MRKVYVKDQVCMGCHLCKVYCLQKHARSKDLVKAYKKEFPRALSRVRVDESGIVSLSVRCQHCADAPCIRACLTGALYRDPATALVTVDNEQCIGYSAKQLTNQAFIKLYPRFLRPYGRLYAY
jgi:carbon-monoxide dehydrogenase iron sulfur subunit